MLVLKAGAKLDYETGPSSYDLTLTVAGNIKATASFTVSVTNADEGAATLVVTGAYRAGGRLTAVLGTDPDGGPDLSQAKAVSWQWQWNNNNVWVAISGATEQSYLLTSADIDALSRFRRYIQMTAATKKRLSANACDSCGGG